MLRVCIGNKKAEDQCMYFIIKNVKRHISRKISQEHINSMEEGEKPHGKGGPYKE